MATTVRNHRGQLVEVETYSATEAKNSFGEVLDRAIVHGIVAITRHDKTRAVMLSIEQYEALATRVAPEDSVLESLRDELDSLVERMRRPAAASAGRRLFEASPVELGRAARSAALKSR
ncbi:MAG TPA: type II toxin-antitoxin system Phd/YefM family antitoxin [Thermoanaerobaculia bacterium]|nr:type II toxin-antitoxin system Phd/YefM family antitoxin [Thermoanaerobaculia bacterium]